MLDQQVHEAGVALDLGCPLAFLPLPHSRPPYETLWNRGGSTSSPFTFGIFQNILGDWHLLCALEPPHPLKHTLNGHRTRVKCFGTFQGITRGYCDSAKAAEHNGFRKAAWGGLRLLDFSCLCATQTVPSERQPDRRWLKTSDLGLNLWTPVCMWTHLLGRQSLQVSEFAGLTQAMVNIHVMMWK